MDEVDKIISDATNDRNRRAWEAAEGREACVAVNKQDDLDWVVHVLAGLGTTVISERELDFLIASLRGEIL